MADAGPTPRAEPGRTVVRLCGITKRFPGVVANDGISLTIRGGEVHALLGENGAGKSTLVGILSGFLQPDAGTIELDGRPVAVDTPRRALDLGFGTVSQHPALPPRLTVIETLMLGGPWRAPLRRAAALDRFAMLSGSLGIAIDPRTPAGSLSLGERQQLAVLRALWRDARVLVLDEPTSMLSPDGVRDLGLLMTRLKARGTAIVFITHKLREALAFGDRVTVLRRGRIAGHLPPEDLRTTDTETATDRIVSMMFPKADAPDDDAAAAAGRLSHRRAQPLAPTAPVVLDVRKATGGGTDGEIGVSQVSFAVRAGEVFGIAGVDGNGQRPLAELIAGQRRLRSGDILLDGRSVAGLSTAERRRRGLRYVTDDRFGEGVVVGQSLATNLVLKQIGRLPFWRRGITRRGTIETHAAALISQHDIRAQGPDTPIEWLSGGNVQKALLARELTDRPRAVVYANPTHGLDVHTTQVARTAIRRQADSGTATVILSTDLDELLELCDRIGVILAGRLTGIVDNGPDSASRIGPLMIGAAA